VLDGAMDGHKIHVHLQLVDREKFLLVTAHTRQIGARNALHLADTE